MRAAFKGEKGDSESWIVVDNDYDNDENGGDYDNDFFNSENRDG